MLNRGVRFAGLVALSAAAVLTVAAPAQAQEPQWATPCEEGGLTCMSVPIGFSRSESLPFEFDFDTGWVPNNSDLQVRLQALLASTTRLSLTGDLLAEWPHDEHSAALRLTTPGRQDGGQLFYHYGLLVAAEAKVNISIWPINYTWQGPIPYVPQIDFQVMDDYTFDAWGFEGVETSSTTEEVQLAQVDVTSLIGVSIPGISGGFELNASVELEVSYKHNEIAIEHVDGETLGEPVAGGSITKEDGESYALVSGESFEDYQVSANGTVDYDGVLHLIPAFYVSLLGQNWSIPIADIPIPFQIAEVEWQFDPSLVRVPLPNISTEVVELDFGEVLVGEEAFRTFSLANSGLHTLATGLSLSDAKNFALYDTSLTLEPEDQLSPVVRFVPTEAGAFDGTLMLASNDPDEPVRLIQLSGVAADPPPPKKPNTSSPQIVDSNCGCRTVPTSPRGGFAWWALLPALLLLRRRRNGRD